MSIFSGAQDYSVKMVQAGMNAGLSKPAAQLIAAHIALSTGWGRAVDSNYILAGIKAGPKDVCYGRPDLAKYANYACLCTFEYDKRGQPEAGCSDCTPKGDIPRCKHPFRKYNSLTEGLQAVLSLLNASRYAKSKAMLMAGNPEYFAQVGRDGWYTASVEKTSADMRSILKRIQGYTANLPSSVGSVLPLLVIGGLLAYVIYKRS